MKKQVTLKINNVTVTVDEGTKVLDAARAAGFDIPTLCYLKDVCNDGSCRVCVVEIKGMRNLAASCSTVVRDGMEVFTNTPKVRNSRKTTIELILSNHEKKCLSCVRNGNCELSKLSQEYNCDPVAYEGVTNKYELDDNNPYLVRDNNKCILCRRCVAVCNKIQGVGVIGPNGRGFNTHIGSAFERSLDKVPCVACGQCINVCPVGALTERDNTHEVLDAIANPDKYVIIGTAPSVRVAVGEEFGYPIGTDVEGKMVSAIKALGADKVFDVDMAADMTIMEEGYELLSRLKNPNAKLPMITSCSPGWIRYIEYYYPELIDHLSTCKSPQQMFGAIMKTYYAEKFDIDPAKMVVVAVMPCTAKKFERTRDSQSASGYPDIDIVLTTRELAKLLKAQGINLAAMPESEFDNPIGEGSSAGLLFGATGGVMEAALRTVYEVVTGKEPEKLEFKAVRGTKGIKTAVIDMNGTKVKVAVAHTLQNAKVIMEQIKAGTADYQFVEIMTCPGGCVNGGGQPIHSAKTLNTTDIKTLRAKAIYKSDKKAALRKCHENPIVKTLYKEYFGEPNSHKAHEVLHTKYTKRTKFE
ncbi:NADH-dependent [FeFe] hydrogenase, group A6 [Pumilibacter intestinalis]|uniref:NADH-dependent [FeFe] hydrogenase, group A6 n=1 Tax=Pumilibacter intestinalis TaxID=2941511 RepID=UPI0020408727|nr:NADH-dependent [FeFe] hydrogenase, group A6 [Pumilibacter intestinalis]MCI8488025.1 2Fe-2S iron-sulfur cluster binding domain-containing protein [Clostridia bacterium]